MPKSTICISAPFPPLILHTLARQLAILSRLLLCLPRLLPKDESFQLPVRRLLVVIYDDGIMNSIGLRVLQLKLRLL